MQEATGEICKKPDERMNGQIWARGRWEGCSLQIKRQKKKPIGPGGSLAWGIQEAKGSDILISLLSEPFLGLASKYPQNEGPSECKETISKESAN